MAPKTSDPVVTVTPVAVDSEKEASIVTEATIDTGEKNPIVTTTPANSEAEKHHSVHVLRAMADRPLSIPRPIFTEELPVIPRIRYLVLVFCLASGLFLSMLDASIVATSLFSIATDLNNLEHINWVALAYGLTYLGFAALFARVSDVVGRRAALTVAFGIFTAFSLGCGFSETIEQLIACRAFQGMGGAGLYSISMIVLPEMTPDRHKKYIGAIIGMVIATSGVMGPVLGGFLTQYVTWRWIFWINGPVGVVALIVFLAAWPDEEYLPVYEQRSWKELDYLGSFLLMAFAVLVVFPFQNLSSQQSDFNSTSVNPYSHPTFVYPLVGAAIALLLLISWHAFAVRCSALKSLAFAFPPSLWNRKYIATILVTALTGFPYLLAVYAFPIRFQVVHNKSPFEAGLMLLPMLASSALGTVTASVINNGGITGKKKPRFFETFLMACLIMLIGCAAQTTVGTSDGYNTTFEAKDPGLLALIGFGFGMSACGATMFVNLESRIGDHASAQGIIVQFRILGGSIGIAVSSAILGDKLRSAVGNTAKVPSFILTHIASSANGIQPFSNKEWADIRTVYTAALRKDMMISCGVLAAAVVCSLFVYRRYWLSTQEIMELRYEEEQDRRIGLLEEDIAPYVVERRGKLVKIREDILEGRVQAHPGILGRRTRLRADVEGV
ncbi:major facilitator superfamily domain-containing protein [Triangularia verruculosa]|uniref:Major facilitator superfamily domain-containing protein n=1 Tax=Triangularia verruculosa TaxID=2587418 RepID=A0AAN6XQY3_9PEZI|nr:major facilitator superfamily domain-containing protein [Triangularia verruculosa]